MAAEGARVPDEVMDANVTDLEEQEAIKVKRQIEGALDGMTKNFFQLALGLHKAYENDYAPRWGYDNFRSYVEGRLEMRYRRAAYLAKCGEAIQNLGLTEEQVRNIGWTKFKEIAPLMLEDTSKAPKLLQMAEDMSTRELQEELRKEDESGVSSSSGSSARPDVMRMSLKFEADAANIVSDGLKLAYGEIGSEDPNQAVNHIVSEWMMSKDAVSETSSLQDWLAYLENMYGVKLQQVESEESLDALLTGGEAQETADDELDDLLSEGSDADVEDLLGE